MADVVLKELPELEIYNSTFTSNFSLWALGFVAGIYGKDNPGGTDQDDFPLRNVSSLDLSDRKIQNLINEVQLFITRLFLPYASLHSESFVYAVCHANRAYSLLFFCWLPSFQAFSPHHLQSLSYLNLRGNPLEKNTVNDLLELLRGFPCLHSLEVVISSALSPSFVLLFFAIVFHTYCPTPVRSP